MNTLKTKGQDKGHSGIPMDLCTREPGPRDRGTVTVFTRIQTEINTRGSGKRATDTDRESIFTKIKVLDTRVGIGAKSVRRRALGVRILGKKLQVSRLLALARYRKRVLQMSMIISTQNDDMLKDSNANLLHFSIVIFV